MKEKSRRLLSIDALRGFDMFFISGGGTFLYLINGKTGWAWVDAIADQMKHPAWDGFTFYDFIFPLFLFISGVSLSFSLSKNLTSGASNKELYKKAFKRMMILIVLGIVYKNAPLPLFDPSNIRFGSVLGRIGIATFVTTIICLNNSQKQRLLWAGGILLSYYAALYLIPVPDYGMGDLSFEGNLVGWLDRTIMPGRLKQDGIYDELAFLTQFPALCLTILGAWAGDILRSQSTESNKKLSHLILIGVSGIALGLIWSLHFPINKHLWTSSFILLTGGMGFLILTLFYWIIDVMGYSKWAFFFKVIGMNSLVIYFAYSFINFNYTSQKIFGGLLSVFDEKWHEILVSLGATGLVWLFLYILYRNKLFVKI
ncbi:heparan-alpha-glucosaminide N-acetyltransferase domain-containing protein [Reichenbachiella sp. MALMAid0571]|uniref:acyltransferase family protein n=1 Tax=Reichenbachiella sp. MALMAid0571 TaxID=3143939 RepID=UPI0032DEEAC4